MRSVGLVLALALSSCVGGGVVSSDPCLEYSYRSPACDVGYSWSPGYYDTSHVWVTPRYVRRTVVIGPSVHYAPPVVVHTAPTVRSTVIVRQRAPTTTWTRTRSAPSMPSGSSGRSTLRVNGSRVR